MDRTHAVDGSMAPASRGRTARSLRRASLAVGGASVVLGVAVVLVGRGPPAVQHMGTGREAGHPVGEPVQSSADSRGRAEGRAATPPQEAVAALSKAAVEGDVKAQVALGRAYFQGLPALPRDAALARHWFLRAAAAHHPSAAYYLGVMSRNGDGVRADPTDAARWFETAASEGSPPAMFMLANAYRAGAGVPKNEAKAVALYERAGELEHAPALQTLAMAYLRGELGLTPDESESRRYLMEAEHALTLPAAAP